MTLGTEGRITVICKQNPGLSREHAREAAAIVERLIASGEPHIGEAFYIEMEEALRAGEEWAISMAMAAARKGSL